MDHAKIIYILTKILALIFQVGDGTTSVVLITSEILKQLKPYVDEGVHPRIMMKAVRKSTQLSLEKVNSLAVRVSYLLLQKKIYSLFH